METDAGAGLTGDEIQLQFSDFILDAENDNSDIDCGKRTYSLQSDDATTA